MSRHLHTEPRIAAADDFYQALIDAHRGLSDEDTARPSMRGSILLLANHIGDLEVLREALSWRARLLRGSSQRPAAALGHQHAASRLDATGRTLSILASFAFILD